MNLNTSEKKILDLISHYDGISRKQLAEISPFSPGSITNITRKLLEDEFIMEGTRVSQGMGRKEVLLFSNPDKFLFLGIDIGGYYLRYALSNNNLELIYTGEKLISELAEGKGEAILDEVLRFLQETNISSSSIHAIGIGVTGLVNDTQEVILNIPNLMEWDNIEMSNIFRQHFHCPVFLDEGGRTMALAEKKIGKAKEMKDFIVVHIGHGLVSGIMINDQLLRGSTNLSGLLGHITVDESAGRCLCGNYGCLENIITFPMLDMEYKKRNGTYPSISEAFQYNDKIALDVCMDAGKALGIALSNVINLFNPQTIFLGGLLFEELEVLFEETRRTISIRANRFATLTLQLERTSFGIQQGMMGACALAKSNFIAEFS